MDNKIKAVTIIISFVILTVIGTVYNVPTDKIGLVQIVADDIDEDTFPVEDDKWGDMQKEHLNILKFGIGLIAFVASILGIFIAISAVKSFFD
ncbi:hypothetical protein [Methanococcoides sp. AM1]|uniref:hypothetical protein n=1 Tax=Methanococcoides sp. AM1 TaxID=1201011 RepID=UPI001084869B|nr:hypothetical protein [Methanococcoides sp. AM1]